MLLQSPAVLRHQMNKNASATKVKYIKEESYEALAIPLSDTRNKNRYSVIQCFLHNLPIPNTA